VLRPSATKIVAYDERWPRLAEAEARAVARAFGDAALSVDHVGSTAVPGLAGKAVLDLLVGVRDTRLDPVTVTAMRRLGYVRLRSRRSGRVHFRRTRPPAFVVHVAPGDRPAGRAIFAFATCCGATTTSPPPTPS